MDTKEAARRVPAARVAKITTVCSLVILMIGTALWVQLLKSERSLERQALSQQQQLSEFEDVLGYGGLIHNFKNWVLRPDEVRYRDLALVQATVALDLLAQLDRGLVDHPTELTNAYRTIGEYRDAIDQVDVLHAQGLSAEAIDRAVGIDDTEAIDSLSELHRAVYFSANAKLEQRASQERRLWIVALICLVLTTGLEITRRRTQRTEKAEAERYTSDMEAFTRIAAHDLKGPLNQISNLVDFIREDVDESGVVADLEHHLTRIDERVVRLTARVSAVFEYLRAGTSTEPMVPIDLDKLVSEVAATVLDENISLKIDSRLGTIPGRPAELETVVGNLLSNAVKHHPVNSPTITVAMQRKKHELALHVIDDGPGVAAEQREHLFEKLTSLDQLTDPLSGVGLPMVRRIVNGWGGDVTVADALPHGADFRISLPIA